MSDNPLALTADQILDIPTSKPENIFTQNDIKSQLRRLRRKWHPDLSKHHNADAVFAHLTKLYDEAEYRLESGIWKGKAEIRFNTGANKTYRFGYRTMHEIELGNMYVGKTNIMFVIKKEYEDLFDNGIKNIRNIKYPPKLEKEFKQWLPKIKFTDKTTDIGLVAILDKPGDSVLLQDLLDYVPDNNLDPKHVAWVINSLYNIATFLDHMDICHNSITPMNVFIDPVNHATYLLGGWWYSTKTGEKLKALPSAIIKILPKEVLKTKIAVSKYDRKAIKSVGLACLGDPTGIGMKLLARKDIPTPMLSWLRAPSGEHAIEEYEGWTQALEKCFGKRRFIKFDIDVDDIY